MGEQKKECGGQTLFKPQKSREMEGSRPSPGTGSAGPSTIASSDPTLKHNMKIGSITPSLGNSRTMHKTLS